MRKLLLVVFFVCNFMSMSSAQDIIKLRDGKTVEAKVLEITQTEIKYKKYRNLDGPLYRIGKHEVSTITYAYGEVEEYDTVVAHQQQTTSSTAVAETGSSVTKLVELDPDDKNAEIIKRSQDNNLTNTNPNKNKYNNHATKWALTSSSVISNCQAMAEFEHYESINYGGRLHFYNLAFINKLDIPIYVDLANSFCVSSNGESRCYYDPSTTLTTNSGVSRGVSTNIYGINVGVGGNRSSSVSYQDQRFVMVAPRGKGYVSQWKWLIRGEIVTERRNSNVIQSNIAELVSVGECFDVVGNALGQLYGFRTNKDNFYTEANSPLKKEYYITYSTDPDFRTYSVLKFTVYLHQTIGSRREGAEWFQDTGISTNGAYIYTHGVFSSTYYYDNF